MEEKKELELNGRNMLKIGVEFLCESVGGRMGLAAVTNLIPGCGLFTRLGGFLIGSGIGDLAANGTQRKIDEIFDGIEEAKKNSEDPVEEPEVVTE